MAITVKRTHEIHMGHRLVGHEGHCSRLHGHSYVFHFICQGEKLDSVGRVIDFSVIKERLCMWLESEWDHRFLAWEEDEIIISLTPPCGPPGDNLARETFMNFSNSFVFVPFNPTAENIAKYLVEVIGPQQLQGTGVKLVECIVEETSKCSASYSLNG